MIKGKTPERAQRVISALYSSINAYCELKSFEAIRIFELKIEIYLVIILKINIVILK